MQSRSSASRGWRGWRAMGRLRWRSLVTLTGIALLVIWTPLIALAIPTNSDAHAYWSSLRGAWYTVGAGTEGAFLYPPPVAVVMWPLAQLPWGGFALAVTILNLAALAYLVGPAAAVVLALVPPVQQELLFGNVHLLMAVALVIGLRRPGAFVPLLLTKITPGLVPLTWLVARAQWRSLIRVVLLTLAAIAVTLPLIVAWQDWAHVLISSTPNDRNILLGWPLLPRLVAAVAITGIAARRRWPWLLPLAAFLSLPLVWINASVILLASWRILREQPPADSARAPLPSALPTPRSARER